VDGNAHASPYRADNVGHLTHIDTLNSMKNKRKLTVSVIGGHDIDEKGAELAYQVGKMIAQEGAVLVCGGLAGVMEAAARGAKEADGLTIGILPGKNKADANHYIDIPLPTSMGFSRNTIVACSADVIIALPGSYGTNSEICYGLVYKRPVIDLGHWEIKGMIPAADAQEAREILHSQLEDLRS